MTEKADRLRDKATLRLNDYGKDPLNFPILNCEYHMKMPVTEITVTQKCARIRDLLKASKRAPGLSSAGHDTDNPTARHLGAASP